MNTDILKISETICDKLEAHVPWANYGGCGFVAYYLAKELINILGKENVKIRYTTDYYNSNKSLTKLRNTANLKNLNKDYFQNMASDEVYSLNDHIVCTIKYKNKWYVLEAGGFYKNLKDYGRGLSVDSFELKELWDFLQGDFWNDRYNRKNNKIIRKIIKDEISSYSKV